MFTTRGWGLAAFGAAAIAAAGCGSSSNSGAAAPPPATQSNLTVEIQSVTLPDPASAGTTGGQQRPVVRFRVIDTTTNQPVNLTNEIAASNASPPGIPNTVPRFTLAARDDRNDYRSYYSLNVAPKPYTPPDNAGTLPPTSTQSQAQAEPPSGAWPVADLKDVGGGFFEFTLPPTNQTGFDRTKTHTLATWVVRSRGTTDADVAVAAFDFVPAGGTPTTYETVTDARCNQCHGFVQAHGTRRGVHLCITCHNPTSADPETSRSVDFKVMIHKIHSGETLPSVQQGNGYFIVGFRQTVVDFSDIVFPYTNHGVAHCTSCHAGGAQSDNWRLVPNANVCTACHDNVKFASAAGLDPCPVGTAASTSFKDCLHTGGPITITDTRDPNNCLGCHGPNTAAAVDKFHFHD